MTPARTVERHLPTLAGWMTSNSTSLLADAALELTLTWAAIELGSPAEVGLVLAANAIPRIALLLFGGVLADRANSKSVMVLIDACRAVLTGALVLMLLSGLVSLPVLVIYALVMGGLSGVFGPAIDALPARILPTSAMGRIGTIQTVFARGSLLLGALLAGTLIGWNGSKIGFILCAILFAISAIALLFVRLPRPAATGTDDQPTGAPGVIREFVDGLQLVRSRPLLIWILTIATITNLGFSGPMTTGIPLLSDIQGWGPAASGWLLSAFAIGSLGTSLALLPLPRIPRAGLVIVIASIAEGLALIWLGQSHSVIAALLAAVFLGVTTGFVGPSSRGVLFTNSPPTGLARVISLFSFTQNGVTPISFALTGVLIAQFAPAVTFMVGGGIIVLVALAGATQRGVRSATIRLQAPDTES